MLGLTKQPYLMCPLRKLFTSLMEFTSALFSTSSFTISRLPQAEATASGVVSLAISTPAQSNLLIWKRKENFPYKCIAVSVLFTSILTFICYSASCFMLVLSVIRVWVRQDCAYQYAYFTLVLYIRTSIITLLVGENCAT